MITLEELLTVCDPDWLYTGGHYIEVRLKGIDDKFLSAKVTNITGWDDGLTVELEGGEKKI